VEKTLEVARGIDMEYNDVKLILKSNCDNIADTISFNIHFTPSCTELNLRKPTAQWTYNGGGGDTPAPPPAPQPPIVAAANPPESADVVPVPQATVPEETIADTSTPEAAPEPTSELAPVSDIANSDVPLGNFFAGGNWSLLSLLLSLIAVILSILLAVGALVKRRNHNAGIVKVLTIIAGILALILGFIFNDYAQPMGWINNGTLYVLIVFIVQLILFTAGKVKSRQEDEKETDYAVS
jgi:hypothetical protein